MNEPNWRKYQKSLNRHETRRRSVKNLFWSLSGLVFVLCGGFSALRYFPLRTLANVPMEVQAGIPKNIKRVNVQQTLSDVLKDKSQKSELTISEPIQNKLDHLFRQYKVDWAAAAVIDAKTGAILALSSHSEKDPEFSKIAFNAMYPAASVFKVVTSAAAMDQNLLNPQSEVAFTGDSRFVAPKELENAKGAQTMSLEKAFANSANKIFGRVAAYKLSPEILIDYAQRFGFNQNIPSDVAISSGQYHLESHEVIDLARTGAGFGDVTLSPFHAALMAAAISNHG